MEKIMTEFEKVLIHRDGMTPENARLELEDAHQQIMDGQDPEELLFDEYGLEPDYFFDLLP
jgi:hypothetical protein